MESSESYEKGRIDGKAITLLECQGKTLDEHKKEFKEFKTSMESRLGQEISQKFDKVLDRMEENRKELLGELEPIKTRITELEAEDAKGKINEIKESNK